MKLIAIEMVGGRCELCSRRRNCVIDCCFVDGDKSVGDFCFFVNALVFRVLYSECFVKHFNVYHSILCIKGTAHCVRVEPVIFHIKQKKPSKNIVFLSVTVARSDASPAIT